MNKKLQFATSVVRGRLSGKKIPLIVGFELTQLCNLSCDYCDVWAKQSQDLDTDQVKEIITGLAEAGVYSINFDGGEVLMRKDIGEIVDHTHSEGVLVNLNSNGVLFPRRVHLLKNLNKVKFSLDGPEDVNGGVRGKGIYSAVIKAVKCAKENGMAVGLSTVISRRNVDRVMEMAEMARELQAEVVFQPCSNQVDTDVGVNQHDESPPVELYRKAIRKLMGAKKTNPYIGNRMVGFKHLLEWPRPTYIPCYAGQFYVTINHRGKMYSCGRLDRNRLPIVDVTKLGVRKGLEELQLAGGCGHCWCARRAESNFLFHLSPSAMVGRYPYGNGKAADPKFVDTALRKSAMLLEIDKGQRLL